MAEGKLNEEIQTFVVQSLACFDTPKTVADAVKAEFGVTVSRQAIESYDPTKRAGKTLPKKWRAIFEATREGFISNHKNIGWAHRATRLRVIQRLGERAESMGNIALALSAAEQAAKEDGDAFTNRRELTGKDGKDLPAAVAAVTVFQLPDNGRSDAGK
jgi:hypothetical protein